MSYEMFINYAGSSATNWHSQEEHSYIPVLVLLSSLIFLSFSSATSFTVCCLHIYRKRRDTERYSVLWFTLQMATRIKGEPNWSQGFLSDFLCECMNPQT